MIRRRPILLHIGLSHKSSSIALRERLHLEQQALRDATRVVMRSYELAEMMVLQTCHRFEVLMVADECWHESQMSRSRMQRRVREIFAQLQYSGQQSDSLTMEEIAVSSYQYFGEEVCGYLVRVVSSLDAQVIGETQITHQFKKAVSFAQSAGTLGPVLDRMIQVVQATAKKIRCHTAISEKTVSMSHVALNLAQSVFEDLSGCHIVIFGAGEMARLCAQYAVSRSPGSLTVVNRSQDKAWALLRQCDYPRMQVCAWENRVQVLESADVIIACTSSRDYVLERSTLEQVRDQRRVQHKHSLFICDLSMPRNVDPAISQLEEVYLFNVDDVRCVVSEHRQKREKAIADARPYLEDALRSFGKWLDHYPWKPVISKFHHSVEEVVKGEVQKTMGKSCFQGEHQSHFQALSQALCEKITALWARSLKEPQAGYASLADHGFYQRAERAERADRTDKESFGPERHLQPSSHFATAQESSSQGEGEEEQKQQQAEWKGTAKRELSLTSHCREDTQLL